MTRQPWNLATRPKTKAPQCAGYIKHLDGPLKGQPSDERCKRSALPGDRFCKTHKETNQ